MFFDRLLKLQTLKFRLLGSSSFAQLYSEERLPLRKFRKEGAMLSRLIAGLLAACGGGGGGVIPVGGGGRSATPLEGEDVTVFDVTGSDIAGATLYFDADGDGVLDDNEKSNPLGTSGENGEVAVENSRLRELFGDDATEIGIIADLEGATNRDTGEVYGEGDYQHTIIALNAIGSLKVLSVVTTIYEKLQDMGLSKDEALEKIFGEDTEITEDDINDPDNYVSLPANTPVASGSNLETQKVISVTAKVLVELVEQVDDSTDIETDETGDAVGKVAEFLEKEIVTIDPQATGNNFVTVSQTDDDGENLVEDDMLAAITTAVDNAETEAARAIEREEMTQAGVPVAFDDAQELTEGTGEAAATNHTEVEGNVLDNDENDIGDTASTVSAIAHTGSTDEEGTDASGLGGGSVGAVVRGAYGELTINADGSYTYVANTLLTDLLTDGEIVVTPDIV